MPALLDSVDPDGLLEYSVVYTDRAVNHMSQQFQETMRELHQTLCSVYNAETAVIIPGSGTTGMEAVARQFATGKRCLVVRNGWFSYRWSQILAAGNIAASETVLMAAPVSSDHQAPFAPPPIDTIVDTITSEKPEVVFAPHVETSAGMILPDGYLTAIADATHAVGGLFVLDCVASGNVWVNMASSGVDVVITAPQKGWSSSPCAGLVMLSERARQHMANTTSSSYALDLKQWSTIMDAYVNGKHAYHATLPTDGLITLLGVMREIKGHGFDWVQRQQFALGERIRTILAEAGFRSVAADGFGAPGVVVCHTDRDELSNGSAFVAAGMQIAAGVPLQVGEPTNYKSFRIGLFGIDKLTDIDACAQRFETALADVMVAMPAAAEAAG